jgi:hypothetical protein
LGDVDSGGGETVSAVSFVDIDAGDDPYGEHDFGSFEQWPDDLLKDRLLRSRYGSPDAADPAVTQRVLAIMLAVEY